MPQLWPRHSPGACGDVIVPEAAIATNLIAAASDAWPASWSQISSGLANPFVLTGILYGRAVQLVSTSGFSPAIGVIQIGTGAAASEQPLAGGAVDGMFNLSGTITGTQRAAASGIIEVTPTLIPASTRIAARASMDSATASLLNMGIYLAGYYYPSGSGNSFDQVIRNYGSEAEDSYLRGGLLRKNQTYLYPDRARVAVTSGGSAWTYGSWVEIIPANTFDHPLYLISLLTEHVVAASSEGIQWEIGIGAAASELCIARTAQARCGSGNFLYGLVAPMIRRTFIPANARVSARCRAATASQAFDAGLVISDLN